MSSKDEDRVSDGALILCEHKGGPHNRLRLRKTSVAKEKNQSAKFYIQQIARDYSISKRILR